MSSYSGAICIAMVDHGVFRAIDVVLVDSVDWIQWSGLRRGKGEGTSVPLRVHRNCSGGDAHKDM